MLTEAQQAFWDARFDADVTNRDRATSLCALARMLAAKDPRRWPDLVRILTQWTGIDPADPDTIPTGLAHALRRVAAADTDRERVRRLWDYARLYAARDADRWRDLVRLLQGWTDAVIKASQKPAGTGSSSRPGP